MAFCEWGSGVIQATLWATRARNNTRIEKVIGDR